MAGGDVASGVATNGSQGKRIWANDGIKAKWVVGETPAWVKWAEEQPAGYVSAETQKARTAHPPNGSTSNGHATSSAPTNQPSTPFASAPTFASFDSFTGANAAAKVAAEQQAQRDAASDQKQRMKEYEDMILFNMRRKERASLEEQIRRDEAAGEA